MPFSGKNKDEILALVWEIVKLSIAFSSGYLVARAIEAIKIFYLHTLPV